MERDLKDEGWGPEDCYPETAEVSKSALNELLCVAITDDISAWYKDWSGGETLGFEALSDIYHVVSERFKNGVDV